MRVYDLEKAYGISLDVLDIAYRTVELPKLIEALKQGSKTVVCLTRDERVDSKTHFSVRDPLSLKRDFESVDYLDSRKDALVGLDTDLKAHIEKHGIRVINTARKGWEALIEPTLAKKWRVNVLGLGDVGGTLLTGLRLIGHDVIDEIGIFDLDPKKKRRWALELGQILDPNVACYPRVIELQMEDLFDCDMFVFCASRSVPEVGSKITDVRMVQYESNSKIIVPYAKMAREKNFEGIFAVVSDPVDQLCYKVYKSSNEDESGVYDGAGLRPEQVRGYGLGVMFARASYYAHDSGIDFTNGRAFGPHGKDLIVANNPAEYDLALSNKLTKLTVEANLEVREAGYKPFIAPALSSGAISLVNTMRGAWNDSAVMLGGVYMGCRNRWINHGVEYERHQMSDELLSKLDGVVEALKAYV
jgi:hypothetical protein